MQYSVQKRLISALFVSLLAACGTTPTTDSGAPVEDRNVGSGTSGAATSGSTTGNVAGAASDQNVYQLDGGNNSDDMSGTNSTYVPSNGFAGSASSGGASLRYKAWYMAIMTPSRHMETPTLAMVRSVRRALRQQFLRTSER